MRGGRGQRVVSYNVGTGYSVVAGGVEPVEDDGEDEEGRC